LIESKLGDHLKGKKVLVTGATGFIGSHIIERLVSLDAQVIGIGPYLGWRSIVPRLVQQKRAHFLQVQSFWDTTAIKRVLSQIQGIDYVVHLAYVIPRGDNLVERAIDDIRRNVLGTIQFIQLLPESVSKICFASSAMVYGPQPPLPVSETHGVNPVSVYSTGKLATENYICLHAKEKNISACNLRYSTVYGRLETSPRAIPNFIRSVLSEKPPVIYGRGDDISDFVHVNDVVDATLSSLTQAFWNNQIFNVGSGKGFSTCEIAERIIELVGKKIKPIHKQSNHLSKRIVCDITRASKILGYQPEVELNDGLMDEIKFFSENPKLWKETC